MFYKNKKCLRLAPFKTKHEPGLYEYIFHVLNHCVALPVTGYLGALYVDICSRQNFSNFPPSLLGCFQDVFGNYTKCDL